jgi:catechol 2,3-dioxygenase-like lactoylglutathione lyase family enzyme
MEIARIILRVSDMGESLRFWTEKVGLIVVSTGGPLVFLDGGSAQLVLNQMDGQVTDESLTEIVFEVDDVVIRHAELAALDVPFEVKLRPVTTDGQRSLLAAHFRDPDGHLVSLTGWVGTS